MHFWQLSGKLKRREGMSRNCSAKRERYAVLYFWFAAQWQRSSVLRCYSGCSIQVCFCALTRLLWMYRSHLRLRFATAPLDVVKIRMQLQSHRTAFQLRNKSPVAPPAKYTKIVPALKTIFKEEGVRVRSIRNIRGLTNRTYWRMMEGSIQRKPCSRVSVFTVQCRGILCIQRSRASYRKISKWSINGWLSNRGRINLLLHFTGHP